MEIFNYRVGNKVVRKDGLIGKIVDMVVDDKYNKIYTIEYKNGEQASFIIDYRTSNKFYEDFFSIGGDTYGNVVNIEEFENLYKTKQKEVLQLKRQLSYIKEKMLPVKKEIDIIKEETERKNKETATLCRERFLT